MRISLIFMLCTLLSFNACKMFTKKSNKEKQEKSRVEPIAVTFRVSFISKGSGTDQKAKQAFRDFLAQNDNQKYPYQTLPWGREGEIDYCFDFSKLTQAEQEEFKTKVKELLKEYELVRYRENVSCSPK